MKTYFVIFLCSIIMDAAFYFLTSFARLSTNFFLWPLDDRITFGMCVLCSTFFMVVLFLMVHFKRLENDGS